MKLPLTTLALSTIENLYLILRTRALERNYPADRQKELGVKIAKAMGFDFEAGRLDVSAHPFCSGLSPFDVRMTTRYNENEPLSSLYGVMHETGHGLYEQGLDPRHLGTPMGESISLGIHESQSRLWENLVGRCRPFWEFAFPLCPPTARSEERRVGEEGGGRGGGGGL